jgi:hypothetical protein
MMILDDDRYLAETARQAIAASPQLKRRIWGVTGPSSVSVARSSSLPKWNGYPAAAAATVET